MDENLKIVDIVSMTPCKTEYCVSYEPSDVAKYVLEINDYLISEDNLLQV